ncbi:MAG: hypothetical protein Q9190_006365 [Brigantiaea leucoxantha]
MEQALQDHSDSTSISEILEHYVATGLQRNSDSSRLRRFDDAPEIDYAVNAAELDVQALGPEVAVDRTPEVFYRRSLPEALLQESSLASQIDCDEPSTKGQKCGVPKNNFYLILILTCLVFVAGGIGLGLKFGRNKPKPTENSNESGMITQDYLATSTDSRQLSAISVSSRLPNPEGLTDLTDPFNETIVVLENEESIATAFVGSLVGIPPDDAQTKLEWKKLPFRAMLQEDDSTLGNLIRPFGVTKTTNNPGWATFLSNTNSTTPGETWGGYDFVYEECCDWWLNPRCSVANPLLFQLRSSTSPFPFWKLNIELHDHDSSRSID